MSVFSARKEHEPIDTERSVSFPKGDTEGKIVITKQIFADNFYVIWQDFPNGERVVFWMNNNYPGDHRFRYRPPKDAIIT